MPHQPAALSEGGQTIRAAKPTMESDMVPEKLLSVFKFLKSRHYLVSEKQVDDLIWYANWRTAGGRGTYSNMKAVGMCSKNPIGSGLIDCGVSQSGCLSELDMLEHVRRIHDEQSANRRRASESARTNSARLIRLAKARRDYISSL